MEEDIHYSSVVFKGEASAPRINKEELSVYSSIKLKKPITSETEKEADAIYTECLPDKVFPPALSNKNPEADFDSKSEETKQTAVIANQTEAVYSEINKGKQKRKKENAPTKKNPEADFGLKRDETKQTAVIKVQASDSRFRVLLVCLGIICFILCVVIILVVTFFTLETFKQKKNVSDLEAKNEQLTLEKRYLQNQTEDLRMNMTNLKNQTEDLRLNMTKLKNQTEDLRLNMTNLKNQTEDLRLNMTKLKNQTEDLRLNMTKLKNQTEQLTAEKMFFQNQTKELTVNMTILQNQNEQLRNNSDKLNKFQADIISYTNFPIDLFCPNGVCQTCPKDWIQFKESCYFFNHYISPLKTWNESRQLCQSNKSDLVVISSLEEQTFIKNRTEYYYDTWHGYWIGLRKMNYTWTWVDERQDTLQYWNNTGSPESFALIIQNASVTQSWIQNRNDFANKFICEIKAFIF